MMSTSPFFIASFKAAKLSKYLITTVVPVRSVMRIPIISVTMERLGVLTLPTTSDFPTHADARPAKTDTARTATTNKNDNLFIFNTSSKRTDRTFLLEKKKSTKRKPSLFLYYTRSRLHALPCHYRAAWERDRNVIRAAEREPEQSLGRGLGAESVARLNLLA